MARITPDSRSKRMARKRGSHLVAEKLENRVLMSTVVVTNNNDSGAGSLRQDIASAAAGDTIDLSGLTGTINFASTIDITQNITITGPDANVLTFSGNNSSQMFTIASGSTLNISGVQIIDGLSAGEGGAILNSGTLDVSNSWFSGNQAVATGSGASAFGGAIYSSGGAGDALSITDCTFNNNSAIGANSGAFGYALGGAVDALSSDNVTITNSTFTGNLAKGGGSGAIDNKAYGGAIYLQDSSVTVMTNCTIVGNTAENFAGGPATGTGGGIEAEDTAATTFTNDIVAQNLGATADVNNDGNLISGGTNLIGIDPGSSVAVNGVNGDQVGTVGSPLDPMVAAETSNGGPIPTIALLTSSTAINAGTSTGAPTYDQRGYARVGPVDIGAYEFSTTAVVTNNNNNGPGSLRDAVADAISGDTMDLAGISGVITFASQISIAKNLTITGPGATNLSLDGNSATGLLNVSAGDTLNVSGLEFTNGYSSKGGAIASYGTLNVSQSWFSGNQAVSSSTSASGGAIAILYDAVSYSITDCSFDDNSAISTDGDAFGGAVSTYPSGTGTITNSTFTDNFARGSAGGYGGAMVLNGATNVVFNSTIVANSAETGTGSATNGNGGGLYAASSGTTVTNTIIAQNLGNTPDVGVGSTFASGGDNLIGIGPGSVFVNGVDGDQAGTNAAPLDPVLDAYGFSGPTPTIGLLSGSPAINAGTSAGAPLLDQNGNARDGEVDIGAFEYQGATVDTAAAASPTTVTGTTTALSVLGADGAGESSLTYTWAADTEPNGATVSFSDNATNTAKDCVATFDQAGTYVLTVTLSDGSTSTTSSVSVTVDLALTSVVVSPLSAPLNENASQQFSAVADDQFGNALSSQPAFTWSEITGVGSISAAGLYTSTAATGSATIQADSGGINGTATVTVTNAAPTVFTAAAALPATVTGTTTALSVLGADDGGEANLTYTWSATTRPAGSDPIFSVNGTNAAKASTVTFNEAGSYVFTATLSDGTLSTTSSVSVIVSHTLTSIIVSPPASSLNENGTQQFAAVAFDQFGGALISQPIFSWTITAGTGSISSSGLYTAPTAVSSATIQADSGIISGAASVNVTNAAPIVATAAAAFPVVVTADRTVLSVLGADDGGENNLTYTWFVTAKPSGANPGFDVNGTNSARNTTVTFDRAGNYTFTVGISDGTNTTNSSVNVTVNQTLTAIFVSSSSSPLNENGTQQLSAVADDQFGIALITQPNFTWTETAGIGSVSATGFYTAPSAAGNATIQAGSGSVTGTANVAVIYDPSAFSSNGATSATSETAYTYNVTTTNPDGLPPTITAPTIPAWLTFTDNGDGTATLSGTPTNDDAGNTPVVLTVNDGTTSVNQSFSIVVAPVPVISIDSVAVTEGLSTISDAAFTVTLSAASAQPVTVGYTTVAGTAVAGVDFVASTGNVIVPAGQTSATFNISVYGDAANIGVYGDTASQTADSFSVSLYNPVGTVLSTTSSIGTATITNTAFRTVNFGGGTKAVYTDAAGNQVTVSVSGGGFGVLVFPAGTGNFDANSVLLSGTTSSSQLTIATTRNATTNIAFIQSTLPLGNIIAPTTNLTGDLTLTTIHNVLFRSVNGSAQPSGSTITIAAGTTPNLALGTVTDVSIVSGSAIRDLIVDSWTGSDGNNTISAPAINAVISKGDFDASVASGSIDELLVAGAVTGGTWSVNGSVKSITTGTIDTGWTGVVTGNIGAVTVRGDLDGSLTGQSVKSLSVTGSVNGSTITLTGSNIQLGRLAALGLFAVNGNVSDSIVTAVGDVGIVMVGGMSDSEIFAGVISGTTGLPTAADFTDASSILSFNAMGRSPFADSDISARAIGAVSLANVTTDNGGTPFGISADSLNAFALRQPKQKAVLWHGRQSTAVFNNLPADLRAQLA